MSLLSPIGFLNLALTFTIGYLDPVTATFIVQSIIGGLLGGWYVLKKYSRQIYAYLAGTELDEATEEAESA
jgi:positive regulator of sigma E activity